MHTIFLIQFKKCLYEIYNLENIFCKYFIIFKGPLYQKIWKLLQYMKHHLPYSINKHPVISIFVWSNTKVIWKKLN